MDNNDTPINSQNQQQPAQPEPQSDAPRITLEDLYGPSQATPQPQPEPMPQAPQPLIETPQQPVESVQPVPPVPQPLPQEPVVSLQPDSPTPSESVDTGHVESEESENNGGFHISSLLRFAVGAVIVLILLLIVWGIGSLIFSRKATNGQVALTYWGLWESPSVMQPLIADFEKQHPTITVTYTQEDPKDYTKRLLTRMQNGNGPDIFRMHNTWVYPLQSILLPLPSSVIDKGQLDANYPPVVAKDFVANGAVYGLPLQMDVLTLFVNNDIFSHAGAVAPTTWDNFITVAKALTVKDPNGHIQTAGAAIGTANNIEHAPDIMSLLFLQNGANLQKLQGSTNATDALSFYSSFANADTSVWDTTLQNSLNAFAAGKVAMYFGYTYDIFAIKAINPNLNFSTHVVPHLPGRDMTIASYWAEAVSNKSKHPKESLEFLTYLAQKSTQQALYSEEAKTRAFGELYARTDLAASLSQNALVAPFISQYKNAVSSFFVDNTDYDEYNGALNQYLANAINGIEKDTSADSASSTLAQGVAQVQNTYAPKTQ